MKHNFTSIFLHHFAVKCHQQKHNGSRFILPLYFRHLTGVWDVVLGSTVGKRQKTG